MALPEKAYFSLLEVAKRWGTELESIRYYAEHDELQVQTWLSEVDVDVLKIVETADGQAALLHQGIQTYCDYAILRPIELRKVFRFEEHPIYNFLSLNGRDQLSIRNRKTKYRINTRELVISRNERDRFEQRYDICVCDPKDPATANSNIGSFAGRLSVMRRIVEAKDDSAMKVYVNTIEARTWTESGEAPEWKRLYDRREDYRIGDVPQGGLFLTAGVDVQKDRLEVEIVAWGRDRENWSVDYRVLPGDPVKADVWLQLNALLDEKFTHESLTALSILKLAIDTGYATQEVYHWVRKQGADRVIAVKGTEKLGAAIGAPGHIDVTTKGKRKRRGLMVWPVGASFCKSELYGALRKEKPTDEEAALGATHPPGYCHFPKHGEEYFKQLTAEKLVTVKDRRGFPRREWRKVRERNETLDCRVYARAAASAVGINRFNEAVWQKLEAALGKSVAAPTSETSQPTNARSHRRVIGSTYLS